MRGDVDDRQPLFHGFGVEGRIRGDHPLREIKRRVDRILTTLSPKFEAASSHTGRPGVPPERLLKALRMETKADRLSQKCRKNVEEGFGWLKTVAGLGRCRTVGRWTLKQSLQIGAAAYHLVRIRSLQPA
jgi:hypothetical protein